MAAASTTSSRLWPALKRSSFEHSPPMVRAAASSSHALSGVPPELRVHGPRGQSTGRHRPAGALDDARLGRPAEPTRCHVDALLEERAVERIGLVEDGQHLEPTVAQQTLYRDLHPGDEGLDQQQRSFLLVGGGGHDGAHPFDCGCKLRGAVRPDDPAAGRHGDRLEHARKGDPREIQRAAQIENAEVGALRPRPRARRARARSFLRESLAASGGFPASPSSRATLPASSTVASSGASTAENPPGSSRAAAQMESRAFSSSSEVDSKARRRGQRVLSLRYHEQPHPEAGRGANVRRSSIASRRCDE